MSGKLLGSFLRHKRGCGVGVVAAVCGSGCNGLGLHVDHYPVVAVRADAVCACVRVCVYIRVVKLRPYRDDRPLLNLLGGIYWSVCASEDWLWFGLQRLE